MPAIRFILSKWIKKHLQQSYIFSKVADQWPASLLKTSHFLECFHALAINWSKSTIKTLWQDKEQVQS